MAHKAAALRKKRTRLKLGSLCTVNTLTTASISRSSARRWLPGPTSYAGLSGDSASAPLAAANASGGATAPAAAAAAQRAAAPGCERRARSWAQPSPIVLPVLESAQQHADRVTPRPQCRQAEGFAAAGRPAAPDRTTMRPAALACLAAALLLLGQQAGALRAGPREPEASMNADGCERKRGRPNIIQIVTDDQVGGHLGHRRSGAAR